MQIDLGNTKGIIRPYKSKRVALPKDFLHALNIEEGDKVEIFMVDDGLYIRKYE